jgi:hypothetical protein
MMLSDLTKALVIDLAAQTFSQTVTVTRKYNPRESVDAGTGQEAIHHETATTLVLYVVPVGTHRELIALDSISATVRKTLSADVLLLYRPSDADDFEDPDWLDDMTDLMEEVADHLIGHAVSSLFCETCDHQTGERSHDLDILDEYRAFGSILRVNYVERD